MKKHYLITILLIVLMNMVGTKTFAHDIAVVNADGVTFYYNYINDGKDLEVTTNNNTGGSYNGNISIPEEVTYMNRTRKVKSIGNYAFMGSFLYSVTIPNSVTSIGSSAFYECSGLTSLTIPESVNEIGKYAFWNCISLESIIIPNSVTAIADGTFRGCKNLTSINIPNRVTTIGKTAFQDCSGFTSVTIPNSVKSIGSSAFQGCKNITSLVSLIENPSSIIGKASADRTFDLDVFNNITLYVPVGTIDKYKATDGWKDFLFIEEGTGPDGSGNTSETKKCATPTIGYQNGKLIFNSDTEGAICLSTITDTDIASYSSNEVQLDVTYHISVYATKAGYENSNVATATLCWIDVEPKTEGITNNVTNVRARAILIQSNDKQLIFSGVDEGTDIIVYDILGKNVGSAKVTSDVTTIDTSLRNGDIGIVKIGDKAIKVMIK